MDLTTLKQILGIDASDNSFDEILNICINSAIKVAENYLGTKLSETNYIEIRQGNDDYIFFLKKIPVIFINAVYVGNCPDFTNATEITSQILVLDNRTGKIFYKKGIFYSKFYYKFEYTYGITPLPQDLDYALYLIAIHLYNSFDKIKDGANKIQTPDGTIWYSSDFIPEPAKSILDKYKVVKI